MTKLTLIYGNILYTLSKTPPKIWHTLFLLFYYSIISKENWMFTLHRQIFTAISLAKAVFCPSCIIKDLFILTFNIPWITQPPISFSLLWNFARSAWFATRMSQGVEMKPSLWAMNMIVQPFFLHFLKQQLRRKKGLNLCQQRMRWCWIC